MSNQRLWDQLFSRHQAGLAALIRRKVNRRMDVSDLAQEAYLRFLRADRKEMIRDPAAYLYTVAMNLIREQAVMERRWSRTVDAAGLPSDPALVDFRTPEEELDAEMRVSRLAALLEGLPPKPRAALLMQYRDGLTYEQIAAQLGVSAHSVKKYVMQGLALCRQEICDHPEKAP
jgi:RNA polymerase sigma factor (sigma-70 family)